MWVERCERIVVFAQKTPPTNTPTHTTLQVLNNWLDIHNPADPIAGYQGVPLNMTFLPQKLKAAGYATHFVGKSHMGMATPAHIPTARGYDTSLHYFTGANDVRLPLSHPPRMGGGGELFLFSSAQ